MRRVWTTAYWRALGVNRVVVALSMARLGDAMGNSILFIVIPLYVARVEGLRLPGRGRRRPARRALRPRELRAAAADGRAQRPPRPQKAAHHRRAPPDGRRHLRLHLRPRVLGSRGAARRAGPRRRAHRAGLDGHHDVGHGEIDARRRHGLLLHDAPGRLLHRAAHRRLPAGARRVRRHVPGRRLAAGAGGGPGAVVGAGGAGAARAAGRAAAVPRVRRGPAWARACSAPRWPPS